MKPPHRDPHNEDHVIAALVGWLVALIAAITFVYLYWPHKL